MPPRHLRSALSVLQLATLALLVRSVAFDRWITVAASLLLLTGAFAAKRGRSWGVALALTIGVTFAGLCALGVAPLWFAIVAVLAVRPFARLWPVFARFDRGAAAMLAVLATALGAGAALAWKEYAGALFRAFPLLTPSLYPHHGAAVLGLVAGTAVAGWLARGRDAKEVVAERASTSADARVRIAAEPPRASTEDSAALDELDAELGATDADRSLLRRS